jgi:O-antigen/teichoic acid export membrane protein
MGRQRSYLAFVTLQAPGGHGPAAARSDGHIALLTAVAARLGRHTAIYTAGFGTTLALSLVSVAVTTRYLSPAEFGKLGVLLIFAALLTVLYNLGSLQGAFQLVYGSSGEEDVPDADTAAVAIDKRRALGTALALTLLIAGAGTALVASFAPTLAELFTGSARDADAVLLAAGSGALGSVWRLVSNVPRLERRPVRFALLSNLRPLLVIAGVIPLVAGGWGVDGVLLATLAGTLLASLAGIVLCRQSFWPAFKAADARAMVRFGTPFIPVIVSFWVIQNVDLYVLARFASDHDLGLYRLASRIGNLASYLVSAFLMAWTPLQRTSLFAAANHERSGGAMRSLMATYFVIIGLGALVTLVAASDLLIQIAGPGYSDAAPLIPLLGLGFLTYGAFVVTQRVVRYPRRRQAYPRIALLCAALFLAAAFALTPVLGSYGAALSPVIGFGAGTAVLVALSQLGPTPVPFHWRRLSAAVATAAACLCASVLAARDAGDLRPLVQLTIVLAYPSSLVISGVIPRTHVRALVKAARDLLRGSSVTGGPGAALDSLSRDDHGLVTALLRERRAPALLAGELRVSVPEVLRRLTSVLRSMAGLSHDSEHDEQIGAYLVMNATAAERDAVARSLWAAGVEPIEIDALETAAAELRRAPARYWKRAAARAGA